MHGCNRLCFRSVLGLFLKVRNSLVIQTCEYTVFFTVLQLLYLLCTAALIQTRNIAVLPFYYRDGITSFLRSSLNMSVFVVFYIVCFTTTKHGCSSVGYLCFSTLFKEITKCLFFLHLRSTITMICL